MGVGLPPLEFTECLIDSPTFRENLHKHEKELENTNHQIKRLIKEVKDLLQAAKQLSNCQRSFAKSMESFTFECIGGIQTDDERVICKSLFEFGKLINSIEDERDRMLENAINQVVNPLEHFRKTHIGGVKTGKKKFDKQTAKFCQSQERYLNLTAKKQNDSALKEADASVDMAERHFFNASMDYVYLIQEVHERKKFEFVETLLGFMIGWLTFYHQGYEVAKDFNPYKADLQLRIQKNRDSFQDYSRKLRGRMAEIQKQLDPLRTIKGRKEGYLFLLEKKAFGTTWTKHFCTFDRASKEFTMIQYNQLTTKTIGQPEIMTLSSCTRRMTDSIDKRFCFDLEVDLKPGVIYTFQALSEQDRKSWMDIMDGKEPTYTNVSSSIKLQNPEDTILDDLGIQFVKKCIEVLESRGVEEQGIYRVVGVQSKVNKLMSLALDRRKFEKLTNLDDPQEWETKTITSALKSYLRNLPEPLMTHQYHNSFIGAVKNDSRQARINEIHNLIYRIPKTNFEVLKILIKHLTNVAAKSDKNLMTVSNLGVCFGPTLLRPEEETVASIIVDLKFYNIVVEILIENYQKIFNSEPESNLNSPIPTKGYASYIAKPIVVNDFPPIYSDGSDTYGVKKMYNSNNMSQSMRSNISNVHQLPTISQNVRTYNSPPGNMTSSLYNVLDSHNGSSSSYPISSNIDHIGVNGSIPSQHNKFMQKYMPYNSQSESSLPNLQQSGSPTSFRSYGKLENSTSSSSESINSREGINYAVGPEKSLRSAAIGLSCPKGYRSPGNVSGEGTNILRSVQPTKTTDTRVRRVRTIYACLGEHDGELSFEPNQIITNVKTSQEPGWLEGTLNGKTGLIPENYVEVLP